MKIAHLSLILGLSGLAVVTGAGGEEKKEPKKPTVYADPTACPMSCLGDMGGVFPHNAQNCSMDCPNQAMAFDTRAHSCVGGCNRPGCASPKPCQDGFFGAYKSAKLADTLSISVEKKPGKFVLWKDLRVINEKDNVETAPPGFVQYGVENCTVKEEDTITVKVKDSSGVEVLLRCRVWKVDTKIGGAQHTIYMGREFDQGADPKNSITGTFDPGNSHHVTAERGAGQETVTLHLFTNKNLDP